MATKKKETTTKKAPKTKTTTTPAKKRVTSDMLKKRILELEGNLAKSQEEYGKLFELHTNMRVKLDAMLGQILKGMFIAGIDPDVLAKKCHQMFRKRIVAD